MSNSTNVSTTNIPNPIPINISSSNVAGSCDLKCALNLNYSPSTNIIAYNNEIEISLQMDKTTTTQVTYNSINYYVSSVNILSPSYLLYNGSQAPGELMISHTPSSSINNTVPPLLIFIPLYESINTNSATDLVTQIITNVASTAPSAGEQTTINLNNFSLKDIVPMQPFFNLAFQWYGSTAYNIVAYGINNGIPVAQEILTTLSTIIRPSGESPLQMSPPIEIFYNKLGPNTSGSGTGSGISDGIYISCQPTGESDSTTDVEVSNKTNAITNNLASVLNNPMFVQVFMGCLIFLVIFFVISIIFNFISGNKMQLPSYLSPKKIASPTKS